MAKSKEEAIALYNQAKALENSDSTSDVSAEVIELLEASANICPHESEVRAAEYDVEGIEAYECGDCHYLNYVEV
jgi:hypothetical protein